MTSTTSRRRTFLIAVAGASSAAVFAAPARAQTAVAETDAQAQGVGYRADATKVDKAKFPKYAAGQLCSNCALYQGKPTDATAPCPLFPGKVVAGKGWCSAYNKKA